LEIIEVNEVRKEWGMKSKEYKKFSEALEKVLSVSHREIKQREGKDKELPEIVRRKRKPKASASQDRVSGENEKD